jgi:hypothetical protein
MTYEIVAGSGARSRRCLSSRSNALSWPALEEKRVNKSSWFRSSGECQDFVSSRVENVFMVSYLDSFGGF